MFLEARSRFCNGYGNDLFFSSHFKGKKFTVSGIVGGINLAYLQARRVESQIVGRSPAQHFLNFCSLTRGARIVPLNPLPPAGQRRRGRDEGLPALAAH
jgi:hypothetical protein